MKPKQRQADLVEHLQRNGKCSVDELAQYFNTTGTTIRKDLTILENTGLVIRTYGGVILSKVDTDQPIDQKNLIHRRHKKMIARAAINLIDDGDYILFDTGSTALQIIPLLKQFNNLTVMTNSLHFACILEEMENGMTVLMPGGTLRKKSGSFHGQLVEDALKQFNFDKLFIGTDGLDLNAGITTFNEIYTDSKLMCNASKQIILVADSSKFGRRSPNIICPVDKIDVIVTDSEISDYFLGEFKKRNIRVILAEDDNDLDLEI